MSVATSDIPTRIILDPGFTLTVTTDAASSGIVRRVAQPGGQLAGNQAQNIAASSTLIIGPFLTARYYQFEVAGGFFTFTTTIEDVPILLSAGGGTPITNTGGDPPVNLASRFIPVSVRITPDPVVDIERIVNYSSPDGGLASPTLSVITQANFSTSKAWASGILSDIMLVSSVTDTAYVEAIRGVGSIGAGITTLNSAWGGLFNAQALNVGHSYVTLQGVEAGVFQASGLDAPVPSATPLSRWAVSHIASMGIGGSTQNVSDAAYMVNPFSPGDKGGGAQVAFYVPIEATAGLVGKIVRYSPFAAACRSTYGLDLHLGTWDNAAIWLPNNSGIQASKAGGGVQTILYLNTNNFVALGPDATFGPGVIQTAPGAGAAALVIAPQAASQNASISFYNTVTLYWQMIKDTTHGFNLYDAVRGGTTAAINVPSNGNMQLMKGGGTVGLGITPLASAFFAFAAGTTAIAQMNFAAGSAPTSPNNGDFWFDGTNFKARVAGATKTFTIA